MRIIFRTDASLQIGTGHVMRCLTLADALREKGAEVNFISREHIGNLCELIKERGFKVMNLPPPAIDFLPDDKLKHAKWLGASWQVDAKQTLEAIRAIGSNPDWLIIDHYGIDERWENLCRPQVKKILAVDDLADRKHNCDLLLDQNLVADKDTRYVGIVPKYCGLMLGPEYALLQPIYAELHDRVPPRCGKIQRILVYFGGADIDNLTGIAIAAFLQLNRTDIHLDVVLGRVSPHVESIQEQIKSVSNIHIYKNIPNLASLMVQVDLAIGASGATSWERLCLGLPSLVVALAENQKPIAEELNRLGLVRWIGNKDKVDQNLIYKNLFKLVDGDLDENWSSRCRQLVDGLGVNRVTAPLVVSKETPLKIRDARLSDESLLLMWANDPVTRKNAFSSSRIDPQAHRIWFYNRLRSIDVCKIYIVETQDDIPIGQVRFELKDKGWEIDFLVAPHLVEINFKLHILESALFRFRLDNIGMQKFYSSNDLSKKMYIETQVNSNKSLNISICSGESSWMNISIPKLILGWLFHGHVVSWTHDSNHLDLGEICFYISYGRIVNKKTLGNFKNNLVVHASDLPKGRGWSPLTWQILEGKNKVFVTLFEAQEEVDSGKVYKKIEVEFTGLELLEELHNSITIATIDLVNYFIKHYPMIVSTGIVQEGAPTYYPKRQPSDSRLDIGHNLAEQFNLLRTVDSDYYPAWFEYKGKKFVLKIEKGE